MEPSLLLPSAPANRRMLGKYEVVCRLSTGGMSEIFLAFQKGLGGFRKLVVLKQILRNIQSEEGFVRMFLQEARITAGFNHPNIAQVFDLDIDGGDLFLAMEFVPGATLVEVAKACLLAKIPIPIGLTLMAVRDTALALHYAHTYTDPAGKPLEVIHRDVAEKNVMVTYDGTTKLLDFGIAKRPDANVRTQTGTIKGTTGYMSPEQIRGQPLDQRTDVFSLGVVLHECLTGLRLFPSRTLEEALDAPLRAPILPPSTKNPEIAPELDAVVLKALARDRELRYRTALDFARGIERVAGSKIWFPEQTAEFVRQHFSARRQQIQDILNATNDDGVTAIVDLSRMLAGSKAAPVPPVQVQAPPPKELGIELTSTTWVPLDVVLPPPPPKKRAGEKETDPRLPAYASRDHTTTQPPHASREDNGGGTMELEAPNTGEGATVAASPPFSRYKLVQFLVVTAAVVLVVIACVFLVWWSDSPESAKPRRTPVERRSK